jgi:hypothetical protein
MQTLSLVAHQNNYDLYFRSGQAKLSWRNSAPDYRIWTDLLSKSANADFGASSVPHGAGVTSCQAARKGQSPYKCCCKAADEPANSRRRRLGACHKAPRREARDNAWSRPMPEGRLREQSQRQAQLLSC